MFNGKTILVTGAAGGIGSCLVQMLLKAEAKVIAIDQDAIGLSTLSNMTQGSQNLTIIPSNLADETSAVDALKGVEALYGLVHLAGTFEPDDFVIATEMNHTIWEFVKEVFKIVGLNVKKYVEINNPKFLRPAEVPSLKGDSSKAKRILKWKPRYKFKDIARILLENDLKIHGLNIQKARIIAKKIN